MKRLVTTVLALITALSLAACGGNGGGNSSGSGNSAGSSTGHVDPNAAKETMPDYLDKNDARFKIGLWVGVPTYKTVTNPDGTTKTQTFTDEEFEEQYRWLSECGITMANHTNSNIDWTMKALDNCEKYGVDLLIWDSAVNKELMDPAQPDDEAEMNARRAMARYINHPAFAGSMITDEPQTNEYDGLGLGYKRYREMFEDKIYYINLFPAGATTAQLGTDSYDSYLEQYLSKVTHEYICYDHYPLKGNGTLVDDFLYNMDVVQKHIHPLGGEAWTIIQSMGYSNKKDPDCEEDFRVQVGASLAFGMRAVQWFCYWSTENNENFSPAIINKDGTKNPKYDLLKKINAELLAFDDVYLSFDWQRVMKFVGTDNVLGKNEAFNYLDDNEPHDRIASFTSTTDTVVGVFKDKDGRDGFAVANYDNPSSTAKDNVKIAFNNCTAAVVYINGERQQADVENGTVSFTLNASDYAFVIPLNL